MRNAIIAMFAVVVVAILFYSGAMQWGVDKLYTPFAPKDTTRYAADMVAKLSGDERCAKYRNAILDMGKEPGASAAAIQRMVNVFQDAKRAGCQVSQ